MSRIDWGIAGTRRYEYGVDRAVFYPTKNVARPWVGLTNVAEEYDEEQTTSFLDGRLFNTNLSGSDFSCKVSAFAPPPDFDSAVGIRRVGRIIAITQQPRLPFSMTYRTMIGNDLTGRLHGYKLHLLYNATLQPSETEHSSLSDDSTPTVYEYELRCVPERVQGKPPAAHVVIHDTDHGREQLENVLYGTDEMPPRFPDLEEVYDILGR